LMASFGEFKIRDEYFGLQREIYRWVINCHIRFQI
jgi:hypothetical protein